MAWAAVSALAALAAGAAAEVPSAPGPAALILNTAARLTGFTRMRRAAAEAGGALWGCAQGSASMRRLSGC